MAAKHKVLQTVVTPEVRKAVDHRAQAIGLSTSAYTRMLITKEMTRSEAPVFIDLAELKAWLLADGLAEDEAHAVRLVEFTRNFFAKGAPQ